MEEIIFKLFNLPPLSLGYFGGILLPPFQIAGENALSFYTSGPHCYRVIQSLK